MTMDVLTDVLFCLWFRYSSSKYLSIFMVSVGIFICTIMSAKQVVSALGNVLPSLYIYIYNSEFYNNEWQLWEDVGLPLFD